eukprot:TRINITY_DN11141_c0_g2_i2.p1 TRINITY_DN11141_c0_g2~~TRINITY_DN11141_c0_g2_i2.p1  ORF type:complete len:257 (+),score=38.10 TRINITY_DN11141_c0_g2_i2:212-982(+)
MDELGGMSSFALLVFPPFAVTNLPAKPLPTPFKSKPKVLFRTEQIPKGYRTNNPYRKGHWTGEEQLRFLLARAASGNDWNAIAKALKTRNETQIRSHNQKLEAATKKPIYKRFQEDMRVLLNNKLQAAQENLESKKVPTSTSSIMVENSLLDDIKRILGTRMSADYAITKEDIEYIGMALIKSEYDKTLQYKQHHIKEAKGMRAVSPLKIDDGQFMSVDDMDDNVLMEKLKDSEIPEGGVDSLVEMPNSSFTIFSE